MELTISIFLPCQPVNNTIMKKTKMCFLKELFGNQPSDDLLFLPIWPKKSKGRKNAKRVSFFISALFGNHSIS